MSDQSIALNTPKIPAAPYPRKHTSTYKRNCKKRNKLDFVKANFHFTKAMKIRLVEPGWLTLKILPTSAIKPINKAIPEMANTSPAIASVLTKRSSWPLNLEICSTIVFSTSFNSLNLVSVKMAATSAPAPAS